MTPGARTGPLRGFAAAIARWPYRSRQFFVAALGKVSRGEMAEARRVLGPSLYGIFAGMPGQYRRHMLTVYSRVREAGCDDPAVLQAALLHDSGKYDPETGRYVMLPYRVAVVLLEAAPAGRRLLREWSYAAEESDKTSGYAIAKRLGWRYPFYLSRHHAALGAMRAAQHGASPGVVRLIADHHKRSGQSAQLLALQAADEQS